MESRKSPSIVRHRRSKEMNSSQESLSSPAPQRPSSRTSFVDVKERESDSHDSIVKEDGPWSPVHESSLNGSRSGSPEKHQNTFERSSNQLAQNPHHYPNSSDGGASRSGGEGPSSASNNFSLLQESKRNGSSPLTEHSSPDIQTKKLHERTFERSLDSILDECTKVSVDPSISSPIHDSVRAAVMNSSNNFQSSTSVPRSNKSEKKKNRLLTRQEKRKIMSTKYKSRSDDFRRMFKDIPKEERLIVDYSCAMQKDILVQGRMYVSQNWICFYAKIFNWETVLIIACKDITAITKEKTARVIPNAIQITTDKERYFFTSFGARDKTYMMLFRIWQNALLDQPMSTKELWTWIHYNYGDDLGLTTSDEDYEAPQALEDFSDKLKIDLPLSSKDNLDSMDLTTDLTSDPTTHRGGSNNEDTDALVSDEVFNSHSPTTNPPPHISPPHIPPSHPLPSSSKEESGKFLDSSEDTEGEVLCPGHDHLEKLYMDEVFNLNIDAMFQCLFTDCDFFRAFVTSRKTFDLNLPPWDEEPDEHGNKIRNITYTLTLNHSIGPKTSPTTEKQICFNSSQPGRIYHIDCETCNGGIPYSESFYVTLRYCMTRVTPIRCRLIMTAELKYRKHVMGMFKGMIEKSAVNGLTDYCRQLSVHLRKEAERLEHISAGHQNQVGLSVPQTGHKRKVRKKRVKPHTSTADAPNRLADKPTSIPPSPTKNANEDRLMELNAHTLVRIIVVILVLLLLFNAILFYKLWSLETYANTLYGSPSQEVVDNLAKQPRTPEEWSHLLLQQKSLHEREIEKWDEVLSTSISIVDQMKKSLIDLRQSIRVRSSSQPWDDS